MPRPKSLPLDHDAQRQLGDIAMDERRALEKRSDQLHEMHIALTAVLTTVDQQIADLISMTARMAAPDGNQSDENLRSEIKLYALRGMRLGVDDGHGPFEELASLERFRGIVTAMLERYPTPTIEPVAIVDELLQEGEVGRLIAGRSLLRPDIAKSVGISERQLDTVRGKRSS